MEQNQPVNNPPASNIQAPVPTVEPVAQHPKSKLPFILGGILLLILVAASGYYLGIQQSGMSKTAVTTVPAQVVTQKPTPTPTIAVTESGEYKYRFFNTSDKFLRDEKYPAEVIDIPESSLSLMSCTRAYHNYGSQYSATNDAGTGSIPLTDSILLSDIKKLEQQYTDKSVGLIMACTPKEGKRIVFYSIGPCGGGCIGIPYVGIEENGKIREVATVSGTSAYFGCTQPLQLTKDNILYFVCSGGDGPGGTSSLHKLSLSNLTVSTLKTCEVGIDETDKQYMKCQ